MEGSGESGLNKPGRASYAFVIVLCLVFAAAGYFAGKHFEVAPQTGGTTGSATVERGQPDLVGTWRLDMDSVSVPRGGGTGDGGEPGKASFDTKLSTVTVERQEGARFSGVLVRNNETPEPFVGVIGFGNTYANGVSESGYFWARMSSHDTMEIVFHQRHGMKTLAGRGIMTRVR